MAMPVSDGHPCLYKYVLIFVLIKNLNGLGCDGHDCVGLSIIIYLIFKIFNYIYFINK